MGRPAGFWSSPAPQLIPEWRAWEPSGWRVVGLRLQGESPKLVPAAPATHSLPSPDDPRAARKGPPEGRPGRVTSGWAARVGRGHLTRVCDRPSAFQRVSGGLVQPAGCPRSLRSLRPGGPQALSLLGPRARWPNPSPHRAAFLQTEVTTPSPKALDAHCPSRP